MSKDYPRCKALKPNKRFNLSKGAIGGSIRGMGKGSYCVALQPNDVGVVVKDYMATRLDALRGITQSADYTASAVRTSLESSIRVTKAKGMISCVLMSHRFC